MLRLIAESGAAAGAALREDEPRLLALGTLRAASAAQEERREGQNLLLLGTDFKNVSCAKG